MEVLLKNSSELLDNIKDQENYNKPEKNKQTDKSFVWKWWLASNVLFFIVFTTKEQYCPT
jgi:hypothetical protein